MKKIISLILIIFVICSVQPASAATKKTTTVKKESVEIMTDSNNGTVYISGEFLDGDILRVSVLSRDFSVPTLGIAFHLEYESSKISFLKYEPGEFLELGGDPFYLVKNDEVKSEIIFGETLRRDDTFPIGEGKIVDFYFQIQSGDVYDFKFNNGVISTLDTVRQDVDKVIFENALLDKASPNIGLLERTFDDPDSQSFFEKYLDSSFLSTFVLVILATFSSAILIRLIKRMSKNKPKFTYSPLK